MMLKDELNKTFGLSERQSSIVRLIRDHAPISRTALGKVIDLPLSRISQNIAPLVEQRLLVETPLSDTSGRRRKSGLSLNPDSGHYISISYEVGEVVTCIMNSAYQVVFTDRRYVDVGNLTKQQRLALISSQIETLVSRVTQLPGRLLAITVVDPGFVDEKNGVVLLSSTMSNWENVPIVKHLEERFEVPVTLVSASLAAIRAVDRLELAPGTRNAIYVHYTDGIGVGLKVEGNYVGGHSHLAGEFGHMVIVDEPIPCRCGGVGCLEAVGGMLALERNTRQALQEGSESCLSRNHEFSGLDVLRAAASGDRLAARIVSKAFYYLGRSVGGLVNILTPDILIFDHVCGTAGEKCLRTLFDALEDHVLGSSEFCPEFRLSKTTFPLTCLGGAVTALDRCLEAE